MLVHWLQLQFTPGLGPILVARLIAFAGSVQAACEMPARELEAIEGVGSSRARAIVAARSKALDKAVAEIARCTVKGITAICPEDESYPAQLHNITDPPLVLFMRGQLQDRDLHSVAIVGSRKCSQYGREQADRFASLLAGAGVTVVSGGARGIDSMAHRGALRHPQGRTIAVLGCGLDIAYPSENVDLLTEIASRGAVLSEYPLGTPPLAENFPRRNRIVSGMSRGVLVVEADVRSGALITARLAADDQNRPVFAIPGRVDNPLSAGPHKLIQDGAVLTSGIEDIMANLPPLPEPVRHPLSTLMPTDLTLEDDSLKSTDDALAMDDEADDLSPLAEASVSRRGSVFDEASPDNNLTKINSVKVDLTNQYLPRPNVPGLTVPAPKIIGDIAEGPPAPLFTSSTISSPAKDIAARAPLDGLSADQRLLLQHLDLQATNVDQLINLTGLSAPVVLRELTFLTLKGLARRQEGQTYSLQRRKMT